MVERGPEKAGVGGSIPSLGTLASTTWQDNLGGLRDYLCDFALFCNIWPQISTSIAA